MGSPGTGLFTLVLKKNNGDIEGRVRYTVDLYKAHVYRLLCVMFCVLWFMLAAFCLVFFKYTTLIDYYG